MVQAERGAGLLQLLREQPQTRERHYTRGEVILHSFMDQNDVYVVKDGFVKVYTIEDSGDLKVQLVHSAGEMFPLHWLAGQRSAYSGESEFEAMTDCTVVRVPKKVLAGLLAERIDVTQLLLEQTASQFAVCVAWLRNLGFKHARERLAYRLLFMGYHFGSPMRDGTIVLPDFNQMQIAETINMTRECVNRELHSLEELGVVSSLGSRICIRDLEQLRRVADMEHEQFYATAT